VITRRHVLLGSGAALVAAASLPTYALGVEPLLRLALTSYDLTPPGWPADQDLSIAVLADIHAVDPWMTPARIAQIVDFTNSLQPDLIVLAGDYVNSMGHGLGRPIPMSICAEILSRLSAPLGRIAIMGNHDVWLNGGRDVREAFENNAIPVLENKAVRLEKDGRGFWLLGLADQLGEWDERRGMHVDQSDLPGTLAQVTTEEPALLLAHEPDIFPQVPDRVSLTISGHTHGGQVRLPFIGAITAPSALSYRFVYGHCRLGSSELVVSGGLGMSGLPIRFNMPPEVVLIRLGGAKDRQFSQSKFAQKLAKSA
jgi:predicted MPP superfamily phosphohydrolase